MIRFIDLGDQILEGERRFAWFDTITDTFETYYDNQTWGSWEEFKKDFFFHFPTTGQIVAGYDPRERYERYKRLFPEDWGKK